MRVARSADGIPLSQAALEFGDPEDAERLRELKRLGATAPFRIITPHPEFSAPGEYERAVIRHKQRRDVRGEFLALERRLMRSLIERLREGSLIVRAFTTAGGSETSSLMKVRPSPLADDAL